MSFEDPFKLEENAEKMGGTLTVEDLEQETGLTPEEVQNIVREPEELPGDVDEEFLEYFRKLNKHLEESN